MLLQLLTQTNRWFDYVFTYAGDNRALLGFYNAIELIMETGFAVTAFMSVILNLIIPEENEDEETPELTATTVDEEPDKAEWAHIRRKSAAVRQSSEDSHAVDIANPEKRAAAPEEKVASV